MCACQITFYFIYDSGLQLCFMCRSWPLEILSVAKLSTGFILKPNPSRHLFLKHDLGQKTILTEWISYAQVQGFDGVAKYKWLNILQLIIFIEDLINSVASTVVISVKSVHRCEKCLCAGPKAARSILKNLSSNLTRLKKPSSTDNFVPFLRFPNVSFRC